MIHNEDSRVKIPTVLHLMRLGYTYLSLKEAVWDPATCIFTDVFKESILRINPDLAAEEVAGLYDKVALSLENEDLGRAFYELLTDRSGTRLIDFEDFDNNSFHVVTELTYGRKSGDNFRPDITLLVNGMPLALIEVKKPNNPEGVQAEHERMAKRFKMKPFRPYFNSTQVIVCSNNMEYDEGATVPLQGAYYTAASYKEPKFNYFREEERVDLAQVLAPLDEQEELRVLLDNNLIAILRRNDFITNKDPDMPTNRICTSLFRRERLAFLLRYSLAYVDEVKPDGSRELQKHIMRYPQFFATHAIARSLDAGVNKGIIWHTQGSGKTALAYYNVRYLTDYYQQRGVIPRFYFIVDRLDLLNQASKEFSARGLVVHKVNSREDFARDIKSASMVQNSAGKAEITVVNIQKFADDPAVLKNTDYNLQVQRVYFLDEVHRSYNPQGSFLANLRDSDPQAVKIGLTGTPLLGTEYNSRSLFGDYIHKYYYNASIADGYTLRLLREEIETRYRLQLKATLEEIDILKGGANREKAYAHPRFVEPMLRYIVEDFERSRTAMGDNSIGGMVVCDSARQARAMHAAFQARYAREEQAVSPVMAAEEAPTYETGSAGSKVRSALLILHDEGSKEERKEWVEEFIAGKHDLLFVYNMLLTGFDAPRLKKLYLGRIIRAHNLLQALTRVNRTYGGHRYGYVVDFAGIEEQFKRTSQDYYNELKSELGDELESYSDMFLTEEEITEQIDQIKETLIRYDLENPEVFSMQISEINDRPRMQEITKALNTTRQLYNLIRLSGRLELLSMLDFRTLGTLRRRANERLAYINTKIALESDVDSSNLLNIALEDVIFSFAKIKEEEMVLADKLRQSLQRTREMLLHNFDQRDPEFISLREELERLFKKKNLAEVDAAEMRSNMEALDAIYTRAKEIERNNQLINAKYAHDQKYTRLHKRLMEKDPLTSSESKLFAALQSLKEEIDTQVLQNAQMLNNESFVEKMMLKVVVDQLHNKHHLASDPEKIRRINSLLVREYLNEYHDRAS